jgi:hypothetical protein
MPKVGGLLLGAIVFLLGMLLLGGVYTVVPARDSRSQLPLFMPARPSQDTPCVYIVNRFTGMAWRVSGSWKGEVRRARWTGH